MQFIRGNWKTFILVNFILASQAVSFQVINVNSNSDSNSSQSNQISMMIQQACDQLMGQTEKSSTENFMTSVGQQVQNIKTEQKRQPAAQNAPNLALANQLAAPLIEDHFQLKSEVIQHLRQELAVQNLLNQQTIRKLRSCSQEIFGSDKQLVFEIRSCVRSAVEKSPDAPDLSSCGAETVDIESVMNLFFECFQFDAI